MKKIIPLCVLLLCIISKSTAQQKKIYLSLDDHTDYMWTSNEEGFKNAFLETLDYYIVLNDSTAQDVYSYQNKWNCDGTYWVHIFEKNKSKAQFEKLITQIKEGRITVPLTTLSGVMGVAPLEATLRDMYYGGSLERRFGLDLDLALNMEDQVLPLGLSSLWAGAGAKYSWRGVCSCATKVTGLQNRPHEIYWYRGLDDRKILMKWYSVNPSMITHRSEYRYFLGTYLEASHPINAITDCKDLMKDTVRYPYHIAAAFGKGGDDLMTLTDKFPKVAKEYSDADYQIIVSNELDFFRDFEQTYGEILPSETLSYGSTEWGSSIASLAGVSASVKRAVEKLRAAEALYTLVAMQDKDFASSLSEMREQAWFACGLYFEHDWTSDSPKITRKQRADWQRKIAGQLIQYVDTLYDLSLSRFGKMVAKNSKDMETFFVFNPLGWVRSDYCDYPYTGTDRVAVFDRETSEELPFQIITKNGKKHIRIFAGNIPSLGYKVFGIRKSKTSENAELAANVTGEVIENSFYKITFTPQGVITGLIDKKNGNRECINPVEKLYANDLGAGDNRSVLTDKPLRIENAGPVSVTIVAESYKPLKHISKLTLFNQTDRIELENYIHQNIGDKIITYSFSFNLDDPEICHEEAGAVLKVKPASAGGHYADSICRLDWIALNHFADIFGNGQGMMLSNRDAYFMKPGKSTVEKIDFTTPQINVLAAGKIDSWLGIESQDGDSYFENFFALKPYRHAQSPTESMKFSLEHQNPLIAGKASGQKDVYGQQFSLFSVSDPGVLIWSVKPAEEGIGHGVVFRIWNMNDDDTACTISSGKFIEKGKLTTHVETDIVDIFPSSGKINTTIGHNRIETFRFFLK